MTGSKSCHLLLHQWQGLGQLGGSWCPVPAKHSPPVMAGFPLSVVTFPFDVCICRLHSNLSIWLGSLRAYWISLKRGSVPADIDGSKMLAYYFAQHHISCLLLRPTIANLFFLIFFFCFFFVCVFFFFYKENLCKLRFRNAYIFLLTNIHLTKIQHKLYGTLNNCFVFKITFHSNCI